MESFFQEGIILLRYQARHFTVLRDDDHTLLHMAMKTEQTELLMRIDLAQGVYWEE